MKATNFFRYGLLVVAIAGLAFTGCKKQNKDDNSTPNTQSLQQLSKDEVAVTQASDDALNDANMVLTISGQKTTALFGVCNATLDSTTTVNDSITFHITYNGPNCPGTRIRVGRVEITKKVGQHWVDPGATTIVKLINFRVTKVSNGKSLTLNGRKVFTNVTGGYIQQLGNGISTVVHHAVGFMTATFDDNSTKIWNIDRRRTFTGSYSGQTNDSLIMTVDGLGSADGYNNLVVWGTNRHGEAFYTQISQSIVCKTDCDWDPVSGVKIHQIPSDNKKAIVTFGYDSNFNLVTNGDCPTYYRIDWQKGVHSGTLFLPL